MSMKEPLWYYSEHTDVTRDCPPSYLSSSVDCDVVFFLVRTSAKTRRMPWTCQVGKGNTSWDSRVSKTKVVRPLTSSFPLGEVTSLITPLQSEWIETHTKMLFCADMYPATVLFRMRALRENRCRGVAAVPAAGAITAAHCPAGNYGRRRCGVGGAGTCASARGVGGCDAASGPAATAAVSTTAPVAADAWEASENVPFPAAPSPAPALRGIKAP